MVYVTLLKEYPKKSAETWKQYKKRLAKLNVIPEDLKVNTLIKGYARAKAELSGRDFIEQGADFRKQFTEDSFTRYEDGTAEVSFKVEAEVTTEEEAIARSGIDTDRWRVKECIIRHWSTPVKEKIILRDDGVLVEEGVNWSDNKIVSKEKATLVQNSGIVLKLLPKTDAHEAFRAALLADITPLVPSFYKRSKTLATGRKILELCIFDLHLGKTAFDPVSGSVFWSLDEAREIYVTAVREFLDGFDLNEIEKIYLPVGNDMFNIDNNKGQTTAGTPIQNGGIWHTLFTYGCRMVEEVAYGIVETHNIPVEIIGVPGNHDEQSVLSMMVVLEAAFRESDAINVRVSPSKRDHAVYGRNFIGWIHGDKVKPQNIKDAFSVDCPEFSSLPFKYAHCGHLHSAQKKEVIVRDTITESYGVEVEYITSLCPTDFWHNQMLYVGNMRRAKAFLYDYDRGNVGQRIFNLLPDGTIIT